MNIILYTKKGCPWCAGVRDLLNERHIAFEEREVRENKNYFDELQQISNQTKTPTMIIDGIILADTDRDAVEAYLKEKLSTS